MEEIYGNVSFAGELQAAGFPLRRESLRNRRE